MAGPGAGKMGPKGGREMERNLHGITTSETTGAASDPSVFPVMGASSELIGAEHMVGKRGLSADIAATTLACVVDVVSDRHTTCSVTSNTRLRQHLERSTMGET